MAELPDDAKAKFNQAARNLNEAGRAGRGVGPDIIAAATGQAAMANISVSEGLAHSVLEAEEKLSAAMKGFEEKLSTSISDFTKATDRSNRQLARWTAVQAFSTIVLAGFTIAQVVLLLWFPQK